LKISTEAIVNSQQGNYWRLLAWVVVWVDCCFFGCYRD